MLGIYSRISQLKEDGKDRSINDQKELGEEKAKELNLQFKHYSDEGISGMGDSIDERPALNDLFEDIIGGIITSVFVIDESRLSRNPRTKYIIIDLFKDYNIITHSHIDGIIDYSNPDDEFISEIKAVIHKRQVTETKIKLKLSLKRRAKEGKATNPVSTYGYKKDDNGYIIIDEDEAKIVKRIFKESLEGKGSEKIAYGLNDDGILSRYAKTAKGTLTTKNPVSGIVTTKNKSEVIWAGNTVLQVIKKTWYYGDRPYKGEIFKVPAILDKDYCQKVNDNLQNNRKNAGKTTHQYLLRGIVKCSCGCNMYGKNNNAKNENYYFCSSRRIRGKHCGAPSINRPRLDIVIWSRFFGNKTLSKLVAKHFENTDEKEMISELSLKLELLKKQLIKKESEKTNTITYASINIITPDELDVQLKRIRTQKNDIEIQILNLENQIETYNNILKSSDVILADLKSYELATSFNDQHAIIHKYIKEIIVEFKENHFVLKLNFNIPNLEFYYLIIQKRFYYIIEPLNGEIDIFNNFDKIKKGKIIKRTDSEFINEIFKRKQSVEVLTITSDILSILEDSLPNL